MTTDGPLPTGQRFRERALAFDCRGERLPGILTLPENPAGPAVLIVVGGPQYRVGSHRQFVHLARHLARRGVASLRFDVRGMGDGSGQMRGFEALEADIAAATHALSGALPDLPGVVIWGLCDGASAACLYVAQDPRIRGLVLANPWVRSERSEAATYIRHYYLQRLLNPEFWRKLARGGLDWRDSLGSLAGFLRRLRSRPQDATAAAAALPYPQRMAAGLAAFGGDVLLLLSGQDLTAREFSDHAASDPHWQAALGKCRVSRETLADANHTFSSREWRDQIARLTGQWLAALPPSAMQPANPLAETPAT